MAVKMRAGFFVALSITRLLSEFALLVSIFSAFSLVHCTTDFNDVRALQVLYTSLNSPSQLLTNWKSGGGDPCAESWKGVTCDGSAVVSIDISRLGLNGTMGYLLSDLTSLRKLDLSGNSIHDIIPYQLPPNLTSLNLASNNFSGNLPYSISTMGLLTYLDLSFNNFSGDLPNSLSLLSNMSKLYMQNNQLTGTLNVLSGLPLNTLSDGNSFDNGPAPPPPPFTPPPPGRSLNNRTHSGSGSHTPPDGQSNSNKGLSVGSIVGIVLGAIFAVVLVLLLLSLCIRKNKRKVSGARASAASLPVGRNDVNTEILEQRVKSAAAVTDLTPPPIEKLVVDRVSKNGSLKKVKSPVTATSYTVASLQTATNSFSQEFLIGEGSLGRVYRAEFSTGKVTKSCCNCLRDVIFLSYDIIISAVKFSSMAILWDHDSEIMAVKKIDNAALSLQEEDNFLEAISNMSRLRHPNIVTLAGYCAEHGQRLLVYEYIGNGSLQDMLHFVDESSKNLTWNARVRVALGTARALEYLHEVCLPSVVHRNFKSANILLDEELNPHLSDCGLAALTPNTERQVSTQMVGAFGYSAPEFALSGIYTVKSDVYSFGVVMLELLTGRKPLDSSRPRSEQSLVRWATPQLHDIDALAKMVDPSLNGMYPAKSLSRFADIIALCVQPEPEFRPPMSEVVQALVRLVQRASVVKRRSSDESGFSYKTPEHEAIDMSF
ncbi:hypothetical protein JRO89_XS06G0162500 [Xanthoceras sorbifolium]|uniref:Protein kinase domain-containing protein n=1 Tax=Xanthoceras sorbifolium TaxID=99658 RepID=A0ABQ8HYZ6_9ROSI|nr:hypothetical protein JRO89_XS06G0162500 [Xanthoceras sorbifolium]